VALLTPGRRVHLEHRSRRLAGLTVAWNAVEAVVAISAGVAAGSIALIGFGLDSVVEVTSALVVLWQFSRPLPESREKRALRLIGVGFLAMGTWIALQAVVTLASGDRPDASTVGIVLAAVSAVLMPLLAVAKRRTARELGSHSVEADSMQSWLCAGLSWVLLAGLLLNAMLGWWWADPVAALVIAAVAVREGVHSWRGEHCDCEV
jgi:divalent metal cation (Fe/Co/Zn/Cd) transporter